MNKTTTPPETPRFMLPERQRIIIAEVCPFVQSSPTCDYVWTSPFGGLTRFDPLNDLNAMHAAENWLRTQGVIWVDYEFSISKCFSAAQRAEAFIRVLNTLSDSMEKIDCSPLGLKDAIIRLRDHIEVGVVHRI